MSNESPQWLPETVAQSAGIVIPCSPADFGDFVARLLGKPQICSGTIEGSFCINLHDVENFHHLIEQRVSEQNKASLVQFVVTIQYDDGTSVELPSLDYLKQYSEVRPVVSTAVGLTWIYLVTFRDSRIPERQQIDVNIETRPSALDRSSVGDAFTSFFSKEELPTGVVRYRINYTARSWGSDIENLIRDHVKNLTQDDPRPIRRFIRRWNIYIRHLFLLLVLVVFMSIFLLLSFKLRNITLGEYEYTYDERSNITINLIMKIDHIFKYLAGIDLPLLNLLTTVAILMILFGSVWVTDKFVSYKNFQMPSFVLLTRRADAVREARLRGYERNWRNLAVAFFVAVCAGVLGNLLTGILLAKGYL